MKHDDEIKALREEVAKLRERVAVLEATRPQWSYDPLKPSLLSQLANGQNLYSPQFVKGQIPPDALTC
jgi:hypothetical protein